MLGRIARGSLRLTSERDNINCVGYRLGGWHVIWLRLDVLGISTAALTLKDSVKQIK